MFFSKKTIRKQRYNYMKKKLNRMQILFDFYKYIKISYVYYTPKVFFISTQFFIRKSQSIPTILSNLIIYIAKIFVKTRRKIVKKIHYRKKLMTLMIFIDISSKLYMNIKLTMGFKNVHLNRNR